MLQIGKLLPGIAFQHFHPAIATALKEQIVFFVNDTAPVTAGIGFKLQEFHPES